MGASRFSYVFLRWRDIYERYFLPQGVGQGLLGAAAGAVIDGDDQGAVVHHIAVAPEHAALGILVLDQGFYVALRQQGPPPAAVRLRRSEERRVGKEC